MKSKERHLIWNKNDYISGLEYNASQVFHRLCTKMNKNRPLTVSFQVETKVFCTLKEVTDIEFRDARTWISSDTGEFSWPLNLISHITVDEVMNRVEFRSVTTHLLSTFREAYS